MGATRNDARGQAGVEGTTGGGLHADATTRDHDRASKQTAMWLYHLGARSLAETTAAFRRHPQWRSA